MGIQLSDEIEQNVSTFRCFFFKVSSNTCNNYISFLDLGVPSAWMSYNHLSNQIRTKNYSPVLSIIQLS